MLLAPSWHALQNLIDLLNMCALEINMSCNVDKTVCMVFNPKRRKMMIADKFPCFALNGFPLHFVKEFKYLGHIINMDCSDNQDIDREIRNLFMRSNILIRRYSKCSTGVKLALFKAYCLCLYDAGIWSSYSVAALNKLRSCYNKCTKMFFGYDRIYSVTLMMTELGLPSFDNLISSCVSRFESRWLSSDNNLIANLCFLQL